MTRAAAIAVSLAVLMPPLAWAGDLPAAPPPGAATCSGCHAVSGDAGFLPLTGREAADLAATMTAFRSGARPSTVMGRLMKGFSPDQIQAIAAWVAARSP